MQWRQTELVMILKKKLRLLILDNKTELTTGDTSQQPIDWTTGAYADIVGQLSDKYKIGRLVQ